MEMVVVSKWWWWPCRSRRPSWLCCVTITGKESSCLTDNSWERDTTAHTVEEETVRRLSAMQCQRMKVAWYCCCSGQVSNERDGKGLGRVDDDNDHHHHHHYHYHHWSFTSSQCTTAQPPPSPVTLSGEHTKAYFKLHHHISCLVQLEASAVSGLSSNLRTHNSCSCGRGEVSSTKQQSCKVVVVNERKDTATKISTWSKYSADSLLLLLLLALKSLYFQLRLLDWQRDVVLISVVSRFLKERKKLPQLWLLVLLFTSFTMSFTAAEQAETSLVQLLIIFVW